MNNVGLVSKNTISFSYCSKKIVMTIIAYGTVNPAYSGANYQNAIIGWINLLTSNGLAVIADLHW